MRPIFHPTPRHGLRGTLGGRDPTPCPHCTTPISADLLQRLRVGPLYGSNWTDPVTGYRNYIDVPAWIDYHLINVLTFNVDALRLKRVPLQARNGKITFGPQWDFDRALNSTDGRDANPRIWCTPGSQGAAMDFFTTPPRLGGAGCSPTWSFTSNGSTGTRNSATHTSPPPICTAWWTN